MNAQRFFKFDNASIMQEYNLNAGGRLQTAYAFGRIRRLFVHELFPGASEDETSIIVECDWYEERGINPVSKLRQVRRNPNFDACRFVFLKTCSPDNLAMWSSNPRDEDCELFDIVFK